MGDGPAGGPGGVHDAAGDDVIGAEDGRGRIAQRRPLAESARPSLRPVLSEINQGLVGFLAFCRREPGIGQEAGRLAASGKILRRVSDAGVPERPVMGHHPAHAFKKIVAHEIKARDRVPVEENHGDAARLELLEHGRVVVEVGLVENQPVHLAGRPLQDQLRLALLVVVGNPDQEGDPDFLRLVVERLDKLGVVGVAQVRDEDRPAARAPELHHPGAVVRDIADLPRRPQDLLLRGRLDPRLVVERPRNRTARNARVVHQIKNRRARVLLHGRPPHKPQRDTASKPVAKPGSRMFGDGSATSEAKRFSRLVLKRRRCLP